MRRIDKLIVHCSATVAGKNITAADIRRWHTDPEPKGRGFADIGYHFVILLSGEVELGRPVEQAGAHARKYNDHSIGICLVGGLDQVYRPANTFTAAQFAALEALLLKLRRDYPQTEILGHRDLPKVAKDCPCFDVRAWCRGRGIKPNV
ncbi:N-acetylmuramoyl-L-alanine amidase [Lysobacter sp. GCM10012299]|uniref:N-acetylmuramoyl-L-alanine amidase n=1 Tax=Lysobacter sp. GCM10012299 TaxID=3317333 RepID=UPI003608384A